MSSCLSKNVDFDEREKIFETNILKLYDYIVDDTLKLNIDM